MTLGFSTKIKNKPTYFVEKIINSLDAEHFERMVASNIQNGMYQHKSYKPIPNNFPPKIHTIREDKSNRWKVGNNIHFVINNRTKNRFQFVPTLKVKKIQNIKIVWDKPNFNDMHGLQATKHKDRLVYVYVDNLAIYGARLFDLIKNDGFDTIEEFFEWFSQDFEGKIIHWTDYSY